MRGYGVGFGISIQKLSGVADLHCASLSDPNAQVNKQIEVIIRAFGIGFDLTSFGEVRIVSPDIAVDNVRQVFGKFDLSPGVGLQVVGDISLSSDLTATSRTDDEFSFNFGLVTQQSIGLGVKLQGRVLTIKEL